MLRSLAVSLVTLAIVTTSARADDKANALERDRKALQGVWVVEAAYEDGEKVSDKIRSYGLPVLNAIKFKDNQYQIAGGKSGAEFVFGETTASYSLDVSTDPKIVEFEFPRTKKGYCSYSIKEDKLSLCFNFSDSLFGAGVTDRKKVPKKLETKQGDGSYLFVLKKQKGK